MIGGLLAYVSRNFDNRTVALGPGVTGKGAFSSGIAKWAPVASLRSLRNASRVF